MFKITFGKPEKNTPSKFCDRFCYKESKTAYDCDAINFYETTRGCSVEIPLKYDEQVFGFGLQLNGFNHKNRKLSLRVNSDPIAYTGDSHAPVPFFVTNKGYGMYFDTARFIDVYCGFYKKKRRKREGNLPNNVIDNFEDLYINKDETEESIMTVDIPGAKGIEIYIFEGDNITDIVSEYNMLSGGGCNIPEWGSGLHTEHMQIIPIKI